MNDAVDKGTERRIRAGQTVRILILIIVGVVLAAWALANQDDVEVDWLVDTTQGPLVAVIVVSAVLGFVLGVVVAWRRRSD